MASDFRYHSAKFVAAKQETTGNPPAKIFQIIWVLLDFSRGSILIPPMVPA